MTKFFKKKTHAKKKFNANIDQLVGIKATETPKRVVLVNKDFYNDFVNWLNKKGKSPKNLNTTKLLIADKVKANLKRGTDFEIIDYNQWNDITNKFGQMQKIEAYLLKNPKNGEEALLFPNANCLQFSIYLPIRRPGTNSYSTSHSPIQYCTDLEWELEDVKRQICNNYNLDPNGFSFTKHIKINSIEKINESCKMNQISRVYGKELDLRQNKLQMQQKNEEDVDAAPSSLKLHRNPSSKSQIDFNSKSSRPNNLRKLSIQKTEDNLLTKQTMKSGEQTTSKTTENSPNKIVSINGHIQNSNFQNSVAICPKTVGLNNLGNTCFFNAAVQCLVRVMPLTNFILSSKFESQLNPNNRKSSHGQIARVYRSFLEDLCNGPPKGARDPSILRRAIVSKYTRFSNFGQHDSQELLGSLLDGLHEDMNQSSYAGGHDQPIVTTSNSDSWDVHISQNSSPIVDIFHGILYGSVKCPNCGHIEKVHDPFIFLSLPITRKFSAIKLHDCLKNFSKSEVLDNDNKWKCENCRKMVCATKEMGVEKCGNKMLIIHLKRFSGEGQYASKIDTTVDYPDTLDAKTFAKSDNGIFNLIGVVFHSGGLGGGHYTAAVIDPASGSWYYFSDSMTSKISREKAHARGAYILFYQRQE